MAFSYYFAARSKELVKELVKTSGRARAGGRGVELLK